MLTGFIAVAALQILLAGALFAGRRDRAILSAGALVMVASVAAWAVSRTTGLPFVADAHAEPVGVRDGVTVLLELAATAGLAFLLTPAADPLRGRLGARSVRYVAVGALWLTLGAVLLADDDHGHDVLEHASAGGAHSAVAGDGHAADGSHVDSGAKHAKDGKHAKGKGHDDGGHGSLPGAHELASIGPHDGGGAHGGSTPHDPSGEHDGEDGEHDEGDGEHDEGDGKHDEGDGKHDGGNRHGDGGPGHGPGGDPHGGHGAQASACEGRPSQALWASGGRSYVYQPAHEGDGAAVRACSTSGGAPAQMLAMPRCPPTDRQERNARELARLTAAALTPYVGQPVNALADGFLPTRVEAKWSLWVNRDRLEDEHVLEPARVEAFMAALTDDGWYPVGGMYLADGATTPPNPTGCLLRWQREQSGDWAAHVWTYGGLDPWGRDYDGTEPHTWFGPFRPLPAVCDEKSCL